MTFAGPTSNGPGRLAMVLALVGFVMAIIPFVSWFSWIVLLFAFVLACVGLKRRYSRRNAAAAGLTIALVAFVPALIVSVISGGLASGAASADDSSAQGAQSVNSSSADNSSNSSTDSSSSSAAPSSAVTKVPTQKLNTSAGTAASFKKLSAHDLALIVKNPDGHVGDTVIVYAKITQFDAATGSCQFRADVTSSAPSPDDFSLGDNAMFTGGDGDQNCPALSDIVQDDQVKVSATVKGSVDYDTTMGGQTTVPQFQVEKVTVVK